MKVARDLAAEALEMGKSVVKQAGQIAPGKIAKTAVEQVQGGASSPPPGLEDLKAKKPTPKQMKKLIQQDERQKEQGLTAARIGLKREMIKRYQKIQQDVLKEEKEREQERLRKQEEEMIAQREKQKKEESASQQPVQPKRTRKKGFLGIFQRQKKGTKELVKAKVG